MSVRLLYIGYWGLNDSLTESTILPHLQILAGIPQIQSITFCTIERGNETRSSTLPEKVRHLPLRSRNYRVNLVNKISDFLLFRRKLRSICVQAQINCILCRSSMAGALGYRLSADTAIPFLVESFEPHANYMLDSGVWSRWDPRYIFQKRWERKQKVHAKYLMPVSINYSKELVKEGLTEEKLFVMPCCVDLDKFGFDENDRKSIRDSLDISVEAVVGIYVGKFGDIYLKEEAFQLFSKAFDAFGSDFRLIILSPQEEAFITKMLNERGIDLEACVVKRVRHDEVPAYLSAADFAFSTIRPSPSRKFCSPIKNGEYWANGLPIIIPPGIGDDSSIVKDAQIGIVLAEDLANAEEGLKMLRDLLEQEDPKMLRKKIGQTARNHRSYNIIDKVYKTIFADK